MNKSSSPGMSGPPVSRLLPGDRAPRLGLSVPLNVERLPEIVFNRTTLVVLWNAGCAGCLPAIADISRYAAECDVACYGVAVMVRDVAATAAAATSAGLSTPLAVEEPSPVPSALSRGQVTRQWLEASGRNGVPAAFIVGARGVLVWMGNTDEARDALARILKDDWDVDEARERWLSAITDGDVHDLRIKQDLFDALAAGDREGVGRLIAAAETEQSRLSDDEGFASLKLLALSSDPLQEEAALSFYARSAETFRGDLNIQWQLARTVLQNMGSNRAALAAVLDHLSGFERLSTESPDDIRFTDVDRVISSMIIADALNRLGAPGVAERVSSILSACDEPAFPGPYKTWILSEIERLGLA